jgi:hypothetical protein
MGIKHRNTCKATFKTLNILTLALQYILSLTTFMINNLEHFAFNCAIHNKLTRHRGNLNVWQSYLWLRQIKGSLSEHKMLTVCQNF